MVTTTYGFQDVSLIIRHPAVGQIASNGAGTGSIAISMASDRTAHDVASDGSVMVSKLPGRNGMIALTVQQTSPIHRWLKNYYNYVESAPASEWARASITLRAPSMEDLILATGVSPQKQPDKPYQAQGQNITWNLMAADVQQY